MITNAILLLFQGIISVLLAPLSVLSIGVDLVLSIPVVTQFIQVVAYVLPWSNFLPLVIFIFAMFVFRAVLSLIKLIWSFIPIIGN